MIFRVSAPVFIQPIAEQGSHGFGILINELLDELPCLGLLLITNIFKTLIRSCLKQCFDSNLLFLDFFLCTPQCPYDHKGKK